MFRILGDPSSWSKELCLTEITRSDSQIFCVCVCVRYGWLASRPDCKHTPQVQNYAAKHRPSTRQNIGESLRVISVKHSSVLPDDGSHKILKYVGVIFNFVSFKLLYNVDFNL
jgi:hypothetical protein